MKRFCPRSARCLPLILSLLWLPSALAEVAEVAELAVSNVRSSQRAGTKLVDVYYNLSGTADPVTVSMRISSDDGASFTVPATALSGDFGAGITTGTNKKIVWNAGVDWNGKLSETMRFEVTASDEVVPDGMVLIPAGSFQMGSSSGELGRDSDEAQHEVTLSAFEMKVTEVTNQELIDVLNWAENAGKLTVSASTVKNAEGSSPQELVDLDDSDCRIRWDAGTDVFELKDGTYAGHPAVEVTWYGALAWCNYLSDMDGDKNRCYSFNNWSCDWTKNGYRLPTESEWEYACRGGTTTALNNGSNLTYTGTSPLDKALNEVGWYGGNSGLSTHEVGGKQVNAYGFYDMHGNVWEWCWDWRGGYPSGSVSDPRGPASGTYRVVRGGGWDSGALSCRSADRYYFNPTYSSTYGIGFRPARSSDP